MTYARGEGECVLSGSAPDRSHHSEQSFKAHVTGSVFCPYSSLSFPKFEHARPIKRTSKRANCEGKHALGKKDRSNRQQNTKSDTRLSQHQSFFYIVISGKTNTNGLQRKQSSTEAAITRSSATDTLLMPATETNTRKGQYLSIPNEKPTTTGT